MGEERMREVAVRMESALARCEGFGVYTNLARVGTVEEVRFADGDRPAALAVRAGLLGSWRLLVPIDQVAQVEPGARRIVLHSGGLLERPGS
jgi:hypothetical protein